MAKKRERKRRRQEQRVVRPQPQTRYQQPRRYEEPQPEPEYLEELEETEEPKRPRQKVIVGDTRFNRIRSLMEKLTGNESPYDLMIEITNRLTETDPFPIPGKFYTFMYFPITPNIIYDVHPLIATNYIVNNGFTGFNFHWNKQRNYVWEGVFSPFHIVYKEELRDLQAIPYQKFKKN